ncbi:MAG: TspO/MBR family protein [Pseudomonadota bacterium]
MVYLIVVLVIITAMSGGIFKPGDWYETLAKPNWTPPNWAFPVVWTTLYVMIAIAGWLVWREAGMSLAFVLWLLQLVTNFLWSALFFGMRRMDLALLDSLVMWLLIAAFIVLALPLSIWASVLFLPYLVWVSVAAVLNRTVMRMNPDAVTSAR